MGYLLIFDLVDAMCDGGKGERNAEPSRVEDEGWRLMGQARQDSNGRAKVVRKRKESAFSAPFLQPRRSLVLPAGPSATARTLSIDLTLKTF